MASSRSSEAIQGASPDPKRHEGVQGEADPLAPSLTGDALATALLGLDSQVGPLRSFAPQAPALPLFPVPSPQ